METEGFAIYDAMMQLKNEVCLLLLMVYWYALLSSISDGTW